jgi:hypothetical protein
LSGKITTLSKDKDTEIAYLTTENEQADITIANLQEHIEELNIKLQEVDILQSQLRVRNDSIIGLEE